MNSGKRNTNFKTPNTAKRIRRADNTQDDGYGTQASSSQCNTPDQSTSLCTTQREEANVGIIESISLTNFMCHSKLEFNFSPNINYVIGRNGSGKSAVLTGLVVGLGGSANVTSRGTSIKNFVKSGKSASIVRVCLRNRGPDAFKPNEYGPVITIERRISNAGNSVYKLIGSTGHVVSNKKNELSSILDQFNIQVENPVSVLNQNTSRNFLSTKSPKDRYAFFMKATQLEQMKKLNVQAEGEIQTCRDILARKQQTLPSVKQELDQWEKKYKLHKNMDEQRVKLGNLKEEYAWALVSEKEQVAEKLGKDFEAQCNKKEKFQSSLKKFKDSAKDKIETRKNLKKKLQAVTKEIETLGPNQTQTKKDIANVNTLLRNAENERKKVNHEINSAKLEESALMEQINEIRKSDPQDLVAKAEECNARISSLEGKRNECEAQKNTTRTHCNNLRGSVSYYQDLMNNNKHEEHNLESKINSTQKVIADLESSRKNQFIRFGRFMPNLIAQIELAFRNGEFKKKPIGPLGAHITLRDPKWAVGVEKCIGRTLEAFTCDNHNDEKVLRRLISNTIQDNNKPSIIVSKFQDNVYDVTRLTANCPQHSTVFDMLVVKDPCVANCLIDQNFIESVLLIEDKSEARNIMTHHVPMNCQQSFTLEGDQVYPVPSFRYYANTSSRTARYLQGSTEDKIRETKEYLAGLKTELQAKKAEMCETKQSLLLNIQQLRDSELQEAQIQENIAKFTREINNLNNFAEPEPVDISSLEEEVTSLQEKQQQLIQQQSNFQNTIDEAKGKKIELQQIIQELDSRMQDLFRDAQPLKEQLTIVDSDLDNLKSDELDAEKRAKEYEKVIAQLQENWEKAKSDALEIMKKTEAVCARKLTRKTASSIQLEFQEIEKNLRHGEKTQGTQEEVTRRFLDVKKRYSNIRADIEACEDLIERLKSGRKRRYDRFIVFRKELAVRVKLLFQTCLNTRNLIGDAKFEHQQGTLCLEIQTNESSQQKATDMRSLSGGERSFTTVCFIIALWETMESPFRILDEYDVFMDMVTRRISMGMMMDEMVKKHMNQFILLTPLDISKIDACHRNFVNVCRMPDPERGTTQVEEHENK